MMTTATAASGFSVAAWLPQLEAVVRDALGNASYEAWLFGSQAAGTARAGSDVDVAISADTDLSLPLSRARYALEESTIPWKVDLVELSRADEPFRQRVFATGRLLWKT